MSKRPDASPPTIHPDKTAIARRDLSRPIQLAMADGVLVHGESVFDYGEGRGGDVKRLTAEGFEASGWDKFHHPEAKKQAADIVNLGFVLNVIADPQERRETLAEAVGLARRAAVVSVRTDIKSLDKLKDARPYGDGVLTSSNTFQHFYTDAEAARYLHEQTGLTPHRADTGVYYLFKDRDLERAYLAGKGLEMPPDPAPDATQIRAAINSAPVGKTLPTSFYIHQSAVDTLPPVLGAMVARAKALAPGAPSDLIKIDKDGVTISLLGYDNFDADPHPALRTSTRIDLASGDVARRDYGASANRPILHRKETFVAPDYPGRSGFAALSASEEAAGLLSRRDIGFEKQWAEALKEKGVAIAGHTLVPAPRGHRTGWTAALEEPSPAAQPSRAPISPPKPRRTPP